jgi:hypothetical protein
MNKRKYNITKDGDDFFKVEVSDDYGFNTTVYERSVFYAWKFIYNWWGNANERKNTNNLMAKAILECKEIDKNNNNLREIL